MPLWLLLVVVLFFVVAAVALIVSIHILETHASQCLAQEALVAKDRIGKEGSSALDHACCMCGNHGPDSAGNLLMGDQTARSSSCSLQALDCLAGLTSRKSGVASGLRGGWFKTASCCKEALEAPEQPHVLASLSATKENRQSQVEAAISRVNLTREGPSSSGKGGGTVSATITATISAPVPTSRRNGAKGEDSPSVQHAGGSISAPGANDAQTNQGPSRRLVLEITMSSTPTVGQNGEPGQASKQVKLRIGSEPLEGEEQSPGSSNESRNGSTSFAAQTLEQAIIEAAAGLNLPITTSVVSGPLTPLPSTQLPGESAMLEPGPGADGRSPRALPAMSATNLAGQEASGDALKSGQVSTSAMASATRALAETLVREVDASSFKLEQFPSRVEAHPAPPGASPVAEPAWQVAGSSFGEVPLQERRPGSTNGESSRAWKASRVCLPEVSKLASIEAKAAGGAVQEGDVRACQILESLRLLTNLGQDKFGAAASGPDSRKPAEKQAIGQPNKLASSQAAGDDSLGSLAADNGSANLEKTGSVESADLEIRKDCKKKKKSRNKKKKQSTATVAPDTVQVNSTSNSEVEVDGPVDDVGCICGAARLRGKTHTDSCPYPFTNSNSNIQRKIREQYEELVRANSAKTLTLAQVGKFTTCLVEAKQALQQKSDTIQRRFTIAKSLLAKAEKSAFDRICGQMYGLEIEQTKLEEDTLVYNRMQEQLKQSPAYQKMLEYGRTHFEVMPNTGQLIERVESDEEEISFEELLEQEKKDPIWHQRLSSHSRASASSVH